MTHLTKSQVASVFRNIFFLLTGAIVFYQQIFLVANHGKAVQPILIFLGIFLWACVPVLKSSKTEGINPFVRLIMAMMGVPLPDDRKGTKSDDTDTDTTNSA